MIKILNDFELNFIKFLNDKHFTDKSVKLSVLHNYTSVQGEQSDDMGFAVYIPDLKTILLPTETPEEYSDILEEEGCEYNDFVISNLAHEYKHFLQDVNNQDFDEDEAEKFAYEMVKEYISN